MLYENIGKLFPFLVNFIFQPFHLQLFKLTIFNCLKSVVLEIISQRLRQDLELDTVWMSCSCSCPAVDVFAWTVGVTSVGVLVEISAPLSPAIEVLTTAYNNTCILLELSQHVKMYVDEVKFTVH
jgi:hypothetical protein